MQNIENEIDFTGKKSKTIFANYIEDDELLKELNALFLASTDAPT